MTTGMYCWWSLAPCCPIRLWSWNCSMSRIGHTYFSNTILRRTAWFRIISGRLLVWRSGRGPPWPSTKRRPRNGESGMGRYVVFSFLYVVSYSRCHFSFCSRSIFFFFWIASKVSASSTENRTRVFNEKSLDVWQRFSKCILNVLRDTSTTKTSAP